MDRAENYGTPPNAPGTGTEPAPKLNPTEARQGAPLGAMRYVLGISVALAVIVLVAIFAIGP